MAADGSSARPAGFLQGRASPQQKQPNCAEPCRSLGGQLAPWHPLHTAGGIVTRKGHVCPRDMPSVRALTVLTSCEHRLPVALCSVQMRGVLCPSRPHRPGAPRSNLSSRPLT